MTVMEIHLRSGRVVEVPEYDAKSVKMGDYSENDLINLGISLMRPHNPPHLVHIVGDSTAMFYTNDISRVTIRYGRAKSANPTKLAREID